MIRRVAIMVLFVALCLAGEENKRPDIAKNQGNDHIQPALGQENKQASAPSTSGTKDESPAWYASPEWWLVILGFPTLFIIGLQAVEMKRATKAMRDQISGMEEAEIRQIRAYVCVDSALMKFPQPNVPEAQVHLKNAGQTPAYSLRGWIHTWFHEFPLKVALPSPPEDLPQGTETLAPGGLTIFVAPTKPPLPAESLQIFGTAKFTMYVYGELRYKDVFGKERTTKFRLIHGGSGGGRSIRKDGIEQWLLKADTDGNEAD